jgi:hypothetical protein
MTDDGGGSYEEQSFVEDLEDAPWTDDAFAWGVCSLGQYKLPGLAKVKPESSRKIDVKAVPGSDGGSITDKGYEGAKVTIELVMWLKSHREALATIIPAISPRKAGKKREAFDIVHPAAALHGIRSVMIQSIKGPIVGSIEGTKELTIECLEWMPQPKKNTSVTATPKSSAVAGPPVSDDWNFTSRTKTLPTSGGAPVYTNVPPPNQTMSKP